MGEQLISRLCKIVAKHRANFMSISSEGENKSRERVINRPLSIYMMTPEDLETELDREMAKQRSKAQCIKREGHSAKVKAKKHQDTRTYPGRKDDRVSGADQPKIDR